MRTRHLTFARPACPRRLGARPAHNLHILRHALSRRMPPDLREGQVSVFAKRIMRKPRTLHCPFCDGKVLFTRNE